MFEQRPGSCRSFLLFIFLLHAAFPLCFQIRSSVLEYEDMQTLDLASYCSVSEWIVSSRKVSILEVTKVRKVVIWETTPVVMWLSTLTLHVRVTRKEASERLYWVIFYHKPLLWFKSKKLHFLISKTLISPQFSHMLHMQEARTRHVLSSSLPLKFQHHQGNYIFLLFVCLAYIFYHMNAKLRKVRIFFYFIRS